MAKSTTDDKHPDAAAAAKTTARIPRGRYPEPPIEIADDPDALRKWELEQRRREREEVMAREKYPPGTKLFVSTARGIPRRGRAGISFSDKGRTEVEVLDLDDDTLTAIRTLTQEQIERLHKGEPSGMPALEGVELDGKTAARIRSGGNYVSPMGAKSIAEDDGLNVHTHAEHAADPATDAGELERLRGENAALRSENARLKRDRTNPAAPTSRGAGEFGGESEKK